MRINGFRCDNCSRERSINPLATDGVPFGWLVVKLAVFLFPQTWTFCSKSCLYQWSSNQLAAEATQEVHPDA